MWASGTFQAALAIAWAVVAFVLMATASRAGRRGRWFGGASLLALVVIPALRISDLGLVDSARFELTQLIEIP